MNRLRFLTLAGLAVAVGCADARSHTALMADAAADVEATRLERAMARFDSARTAAPDDSEAHRQYAMLAHYFDLFVEASRAWEQSLELEPADPVAWDGYMTSLRLAGRFETDRRYLEKLLDLLPEALRASRDRPMIYVSALSAARELGDLDGYRAILIEQLATRPEDPLMLNALGAALVSAAEEGASDRAGTIRDSIGAALDALAAARDDVPETEASILYRLASGYDLIGREEESDHWLGRLTAASDRGVLADDLLAEDLSADFQAAFQGSSPEELLRIADEGLAAATTLKNRATWTTWRFMAVGQQAMGPELAPELAERLFDAALEVLAWRNAEQWLALDGLIQLGLRPQVVLERAVAIEEGLRADRPGFLDASAKGYEREENRRREIDRARIVQARMLAQLGETEAAEELFQELATESRSAQTLRAFGTHLLETDRPAEALDAFVEVMAFGGVRLRPLAERAAAAAGLPPEAVDERFAVRSPLVEAELAETALGERLDRRAPALVLEDQRGVEWRLSDLVGKVVVLKFWATWCPPCLAEFPHLVGSLEAYEGDEEVVFLTIVTADSPRSEVEALLAEEGYTFPVLFADAGLALDFEILAYPTTLYVDPDGIIRFLEQGYRPAGYAELMRNRIDALRTD